jgi:hypothetical protein
MGLCVDEPRRFIVVDFTGLVSGEVLCSLHLDVALLVDSRASHPTVGGRNGDSWNRLGNCGIGTGITFRFRYFDVRTGRRSTFE